MIDTPQIQMAIKTLQQYKDGKRNLEEKIKSNEQFWKLRHWEQQRHSDKFVPATAWLWNVIVSKHADMEEAFPEPNILPREQGDEQQAEILKEIIPVILEQNDFRTTYSDCNWYKLKQGCAIYGVYWDKSKNGIGDIAVKKIDALNLFWEPGVTNIQDSRNVFHTELVDNDVLEALYPQLQGKLGSNVNIFQAKYIYDDHVDTSEKSTVVGWYYHKTNSVGKKVLHYAKFCGEILLYATENETEPITAPVIDAQTGQQALDSMGMPAVRMIAPSKAETGLYDHSMYPFVFDSLYDIEGTPFGYGYTDIGKDTQVSIDQLNRAAVRNTLIGSSPRFFVRQDASINIDDFADWEKELITVSGNIDDTSIREINTTPIASNYIDILNNQIEMLKETSGNRDVNNGGSTAGVTAASAIAALQEQGNKNIRDVISNTYTAYKQIILMVIELMRQYYDTPRQFRILGEHNVMRFVSFDNTGIKPQPQGTDFGMYMGERMPLFDIDVSAQKATTYSKISQNELMLQFYNLGFFNPQMSDMALACLEGMDFTGKDDVEERIRQNGTLLQILQQLYQVAYQLAGTYDQRFLEPIMQMGAQAGMQVQMPQAQGNADITETDTQGALKGEEHPFVQKAREQANDVAPS